MDLLNATYEVLLQLLARYFANTDESPTQLATLADVAVSLMYAGHQAPRHARDPPADWAR